MTNLNMFRLRLNKFSQLFELSDTMNAQEKVYIFGYFVKFCHFL